MKGKIIFGFSMLIVMSLGGMVYLICKQGIKNDIVPIIFMGTFCVFLIAFVITMLVVWFKSDHRKQ